MQLVLPTANSHWPKVGKGLPWKEMGIWLLPKGDGYNLKCKKPMAFKGCQLACTEIETVVMKRGLGASTSQTGTQAEEATQIMGNFQKGR